MMTMHKLQSLLENAKGKATQQVAQGVVDPVGKEALDMIREGFLDAYSEHIQDLVDWNNDDSVRAYEAIRAANPALFKSFTMTLADGRTASIKLEIGTHGAWFDIDAGMGWTWNAFCFRTKAGRDVHVWPHEAVQRLNITGLELKDLADGWYEMVIPAAGRGTSNLWSSGRFSSDNGIYG